ncbi:unnamed protein product, partial [Amoebophrya sp. A25]
TLAQHQSRPVSPSSISEVSSQFFMSSTESEKKLVQGAVNSWKPVLETDAARDYGAGPTLPDYFT